MSNLEQNTWSEKRLAASSLLWLQAELRKLQHPSVYSEFARAAQHIELTEGISQDLIRCYIDIKRRQLDLGSLSAYLTSVVRKFPTDYDLIWQSALASFESGDHELAQARLQKLRHWLEQMPDCNRPQMRRLAANVGLHSLARQVHQTIDSRNSALLRRLKFAETNAAADFIDHVKVVSIGTNTLPWLTLNRWGLRPETMLYSRQGPYDLIRTTTEGVAALLSAGHHPIVDTRLLKVGEWYDEAPRPYVPDFSAGFLFEIGQHWSKDGFSNLKDRYNRKIKYFSRSLRSDPCVLVHYTEDDGDLHQLECSVRSCMGHTQYRLVIIDAWTGYRILKPNEPLTRYVKIKTLPESCSWDDPMFYESDDGVACEREVVEPVLAATQDLFQALQGPTLERMRTKQ